MEARQADSPAAPDQAGLLLIGFVLILVAQYLALSTSREPYPAVDLPGFGDPPGIETLDISSSPLQLTLVDSRGSEVTYDKAELFAGAPSSNWGAMMKTVRAFEGSAAEWAWVDSVRQRTDRGACVLESSLTKDSSDGRQTRVLMSRPTC